MKRIYLLLLLSLSGISLFAQMQSDENNPLDIPKVVPPSPNAASLGKYGDVPVSLYTGIPNISIPLYDVAFGKFSFPISLSYYAGGLKVNELASQVGLGWSLNAGGVVTRSVNVKPDEIGYMSQGRLADMDSLVPSGTLMKQAAGGVLDLVPDDFSFNFAGKSGKFIIDASPENKAHIIPFQPLQITYPKRLDSIQIIDENGIIYRFSAYETSYTVGTVFEESYRSSWYLTRIITPYGNAEFTYTDDADDIISEQQSELDYTKISGTCDAINGGQPLPVQVHASVKMLKSIVTPSCKINFYNSANRRDAAYRSKLDSIVVADLKGNRIKSFSLRYGYFGSLTDPSLKTRRLKLDSLSEEGATSTGAKWHIFDYFSPESVPATDSKSQDIWGFYNGKSNSKLLPAVDTFIGGQHIILSGANRNADFSSTRVGMLKTIIYPTAGTTEFVYEGNDYGYVANKQTTERPKIFLSETASARSQAGSSSNILESSADFRVPFRQDVVFNYTGINNGFTSPDGNPSVYIYKVGTNNSLTLLYQKGTLMTSLELKMTLDTGLYRIKAIVDDLITEHAFITARWYDLGNDTLKVLTMGGMRIKEVITTDRINPSPQVRKFVYRDIGDPRRSSGNIVSDFRYVETKITDPSVNNCRFLIRSSFPVAAFSTTHGNPVGYMVVTELMDDGKAGKKRSEFSKGNPNSRLQEYLGSITDNNATAVEGSEKYLANYDYTRGSLISETVLDSSGRAISRTDILYNLDSLGNSNYFRAKVVYGYTFPVSNGQLCQFLDCSRVASIQGLRLIPASIECPWIYEVQRKETFYGMPGDPMLVNTVKNYYDNPAHAQLTRIMNTQSNGRTDTSYLKYPLDFNISTSTSDQDALGIKYLQDRHFLGNLIEKYTTGVDATDLSGAIITYNGDKPFPKSVWAYEPDGLLNRYTPARISSGAFLKDTRYKQRITFDRYDSTGNIQQQGKLFDVPEIYLWGYNNQYPVAKIVGADYTTAAAIVSKDILRAPVTAQQLRDELNKLRTNLPTALVTTYTYIPLIGISSETDASGKTTFYEYDPLGRLKLVRDNDGKILKQMDYQYKASINR